MNRPILISAKYIGAGLVSYVVVFLLFRVLLDWGIPNGAPIGIFSSMIMFACRDAYAKGKKHGIADQQDCTSQQKNAGQA